MRLRLVMLLACVVVAGCLPVEMISWSPDGRQAVIRGDDGIYVSDGEGRLSEKIAGPTVAMSWLADSQHVVLVRRDELKSWTELEPLLSPARRVEVVADAEALRIEMRDRKNGQVDLFSPKRPGYDIAAVVLYLREDHKQEVIDYFSNPEYDKNVESLTHNVYTAQLYRVVDGKAEAGATLFRCVDEVAQIAVSPNGKAVAWTVERENSGPVLLAQPLAGKGTAVVVAENTSQFFAWSGDSRYLAFVRLPEPPKFATQFGLLSRREVLDASGKLVLPLPAQVGGADVVLAGPPTTQPEKDAFPIKDLVRLSISERTRVQLLPDGRFVFAAEEMKLPTKADDSGSLALFAGEADTGKVERLAAADSAEFVVSPDGKRVAFINNDSVSVLTLAGGEMTSLAKGDSRHDTSIAPAWRSSTELSFLRPAEKDGQRPEIVIWSATDGKIRAISGKWSAEHFSVLKPASQPERHPEK